MKSSETELSEVILFHTAWSPPRTPLVLILRDFQRPNLLPVLSFGIYGTEDKMRFLDSSYFMALSTDKGCEQHLSIIFYS